MKIPAILFAAIISLTCWGCIDDTMNNLDPGKSFTNDTQLEDLVNDLELNTGIVHQKGHQLTKLHVISSGQLNDYQKVVISTLQGIAAKSSGEQPYIDEGGPGTVWIEAMRSKYGIQVVNHSSFSAIFEYFRALGIIKGYVLYDHATNSRSLTAATSICGPAQAIAVDKSIESDIKMAGVGKKLIDVSDMNEKWVYNAYPQGFSKSICAELSPGIFHQLRDYATLTNSFTFYDGLTDFRDNVMSALDPGSYCFGYYADNEFNMVAKASALGISMLPADVASNLAVHSSIYGTTGLKQRDPAATIPTETGVHYVTFLLSDGDNIAYDLWSLQSYYSNTIRGTIPMGYTITPSMYDLAPAALRWYYDNMTAKDYFVCGPSGSSYVFPSRMPAAALDAYLVKLNEFTGATGLRIVNILDQKGQNAVNQPLWDKYLAKPNIDALMYTGYGETPGDTPRIEFFNGKPMIWATDNLWGDGSKWTEKYVYDRVNARTTDITQKAAYSLIFVHTWTKDFSNVKTVVDKFNSKVRVVTPDVFVKLIVQNVPH